MTTKYEGNIPGTLMATRQAPGKGNRNVLVFMTTKYEGNIPPGNRLRLRFWK